VEILNLKRKGINIMKTSNHLILSTSPLSQPTRKPCKTASLSQKRFLYRGRLRYHTGKERDCETGLYYYGARYLDSKTSRWLSGDPAIGEYIPGAPIDDEAKKRNKNLPGQGGVFNYINFHVYHYAGNNPVKYVDPNGEADIITAETTKEKYDEMARFDADLAKENTWENAQTYLQENPNGAFYRAPGELQWQQFEDKNDIEVIDPNSANVDLMSAFMIGKSVFSAGKTLANGLTKSPAKLQQIANESIASGAKRQQLFKFFDGKIRLERGVEAVNTSVQKELGVKVSGAIQKPWHLVVNGKEIPLNPLNPLWKFFHQK
jgi:RHS repeat-associated protein